MATLSKLKNHHMNICNIDRIFKTVCDNTGDTFYISVVLEIGDTTLEDEIS